MDDTDIIRTNVLIVNRKNVAKEKPGIKLPGKKITAKEHIFEKNSGSLV